MDANRKEEDDDGGIDSYKGNVYLNKSGSCW